MKTAATAVLLAACLALPAAGGAEDAADADDAKDASATEGAAPEIPEEKEQAIRKLMELTGAADYGDQLSQNLLSQLEPAFPEVPDSRWPEVAESLDTSQVTERVVAVYDRHFELEELRAMVEFYSTPIGQDVLQKLPLVMQESMQAGQSWGQSKAREIVEELSADGFEPVRR